MATIDTRKNKKGEITGYRLRACVGRDEQYKQVWRTCTIPRPEGLTPAKEKKEVQRLADEWEKDQKAEYERTHSKEDRDKITLADFIKNHWWVDHVMDGTHTPSSISFYYNIFTVQGTAASRVFFRIVAKAVRMGEHWPDKFLQGQARPKQSPSASLSFAAFDLCR